MRRPTKLVALASLLIFAVVGGLLLASALLPGSTAASSAGPASSPTASPTPVESPTASPTPVESPTASPTPVESPTTSPTPIESPTASPTPEGTNTITITGEPQPIARVETIVTKGDQLPTADIAEAKVIRVSGRDAEPAVTTVKLFSGDEIETGANTYVTVVFLEGALERENEIIIYPDSKITVGSGWTWWGRAFYRVRGWLSAGSDNVAGGSGGTEFTVTVCKENIKPIWCQNNNGKPPGNGTDVTVLDDNVDALTYDVAIDATPGNASQVARTITIKSQKPQCRKAHVYELEAPDNMPWLEFLPRSVLLKPGREATFIPRIVRYPDRPDPEPGEYKGKVEIKCFDCAEREPNCEFDTAIGGATIPIEVKVRQVKVEKRHQIDVREKQPDVPKPRAIPKEEAEVLVDKTSDVILSTQPKIAVPTVMQNYTDAERKEVFKQARAAALVRNEPQGYRDMGRVNVDWGKGAKALEALEKVPDSSADKKTADFPSNMAEAYRLTDDLEKAQEQIEVAKTRMADDLSTVRVMTVQGNIYLDRALGALKLYAQSKDERLLTTADTYLNQAQQSYIHAVRPIGMSMQPQLKAVPLTNLGDAYRLQGETLVSRKANAQEINVANENALTAYTKALTLNSGDRNARKGQGYILLQKAALTQSDFERTSLFRRAKEDFEKAIAEDSKDSQALVGRSLANAELGENTQARRDIQNAIKGQYESASLVSVPDVTGKPKAVAARELVDVKLEPIFSGKGTVVIDQKPKGARVKRGTKVTLRLG